MTEVFHHHHHHKKIEKHVHKENWINIIDNLVYFSSTVCIVMTFPQIIKIWMFHTAQGVSAASWIAYTFSAAFWSLYGIAHKSVPITIINIIWVLLDITIIIGTFMYGGGW